MRLMHAAIGLSVGISLLGCELHAQQEPDHRLHQYHFGEISIPPASEDEPIAENLSIERAITYLEGGAKAWANDRGCVSCHWSCPAFTDTFPLGEPRRCIVAGRAGRYPPEYRERLVELARAGRSAGSLAREFEPSEQTIRNWVRQGELDEGERRDGLTTETGKEMSRLKRENKRLRMERDILKRAAAWFARESDSIPSGGTRS